MNFIDKLKPESPEKIQRDFEATAQALGKVLIRWYEEAGEIPNISSSVQWIDTGQDGTWDSGYWQFIIHQPGLADVNVSLKTT